MPPLRAILLAVLFLAGLALSGTQAADSPDYLVDVWTSDDDLPDTSVTAITQTPDGYLWIGTHNGLARFDGVRFTTFDPANTPALKHARVNHLFTDTHGALWINTYDGSMTSLRDGKFTHEWQGAEVVGFFTASNRIYCATLDSGVATRPDPATGSNQWQTISLDNRRVAARYFCQDAAGVIWCQLNNGAIKRIQGTNVAQVPDAAGLANEKISCLTADPAGRVWAGSDKHILRWNGERFEDETPTNGEPLVAIKFLFCTANNGLWAIANDSIRHAVGRRWVAGTDSWSDLVQTDPFYIRAYEESSGNVWFRQYGHGLFCAGNDGRFSRVSSASGLPNSRVSSWFQDREGNIWVGMDRGGLVRLRQRQFQIVGDDSAKNYPVATVCEDASGNLWFGTFDHGLNRWRDGQLDNFDLNEGVNKTAFFAVFPGASGRLWLSADHEDLYALETNGLLHSLDSVHGIKSIFEDREGRVWLGRQTQLSCWTNGAILNFGPRNGFERNDVRALAQDRAGNIWIGTGNGVLYQFSGGKFTAFKPDDGPENQAIWSLLADDDGAIWIGTFRGGLLRFKDGRFTRYTTRDGLPSDVICQILDDHLGKLWFGSHKGIFHVSRESFAAFDQGKVPSLPCITYGLNDGLPSLECSGNYQPSAWRGRDGRLWFATVKGLVGVAPEKVQANRLAPQVVIEDCLVDGKRSGTQGVVRIPPGRHQFEFQFTALSFTAPDKIKFRCRLKGFDNDWIKMGDARHAAYGPLAPGNYQFQVIACNNDGVWNETGASLALTQLPFFWQTWWFAVLSVVFAGLGIAGVVTYAATRRLQRKLENLKRQHAIERERERIAKDIHDDLGAGLTQIMFQSSLAKNASTAEMQSDLSQISETARDLVRAMDEIVWAINPENDTLDGLVTYLGKYVQEFLTAAKLRCRLDLPAELPHITVSAEIRHHVYLAIKETLNNVVKHARATEVLFQLELQPGAFAFVIKDNGIGLASPEAPAGTQPSRISSGHGLRNLPQRLAAIGGRCTVTSESGQGTRVELGVSIRHLAATNPNENHHP